MFGNYRSFHATGSNKRRIIVPEGLSVNEDYMGIRREHAWPYFLNCGMERTFSKLEEVMKAENIWYTTNKDYDTAICLKATVYNLLVVSNM